MNSLQRLVLERDRRFNTERQMRATERWTATHLICLDCRHLPNVRALINEWERAHPSPWLGPRPNWPGLDGKCPVCLGQLVEVTW